MRILYGVVGEGMGHAIRSRVIIDHLVAQGNDVEVVVSGRAHDYLKAREGDHLGVNRIWGLTIVYEDNEVRNFRTVLQNLKGAVAGGWPRNVLSYFQLADEFRPDVVISDFESWSFLYGKMHGIPVLSIDNMQILPRCTHPPEVLAGHELDFQLAKSVVKAKLPGCFHYLVTTFFYPPIRKPRTTLHPPALRPEIVDATPERGEHLLVYQTSTSNTELPELLRACARECRVYGLRRDLTEEVTEGNVRYEPFSETAFVEDLRTARAVIANGGFTLLSEAVYLHKPVLALPVKKQFEQVLNARYLQREGFGVSCEEELDGKQLGAFLDRVPEFELALAHYAQDGNAALLSAVDVQLARAVTERSAGAVEGW
ncbi:MAG TPA: MJ1255/VC2487 family glycosyltransferase [Anaeromyxobacteraceae bacterium]|nr:MJ1255/VC2487 family glycosyltransferase [Anaeromyxobacteraceae bacterium]